MSTSILLLAGVCAVVVLLRPPDAARRLRSGPATGPHRRRFPRPASSRASPPAVVPGPLVLDLVAAVVDAGASPAAATRTTGAALLASGDPRGRHLLVLATELLHPGADADTSPSRPADPFDALAATLRLAVRSGLPPAGLVRQAAAEERRRVAAVHRRSLRRLEVLLVLPVGLCLLPAFVLLGVVPVVVDLLGG